MAADREPRAAAPHHASRRRAEGPPTAPQPALAERFPALRNLRWMRRRRIPQVRQQTVIDSAAACLTMVLGYHGKKLRLQDVRAAMPAGQRGISAAVVLETARYFGLQGRSVEIGGREELRYLDAGAILLWRFNHFVVLERLARDGAWVVDPARGRRLVTGDELRRSFLGVALSFLPGEDFEPEVARRRGARRYLHRLLAESGLLSRIVATSAFVHVLALAVPLLTALLVDRIVPRGDLQLWTVLALGIAGVVAFGLLASLVRSFLLIHLRTRLDARLTQEFLDHLVDLPYLFFQRRSAGDLMMRLTSNATIRELLTSGALSAVLDGVVVTLYLALLAVAKLEIAALVAVLGALRIGTFLAVRGRIHELMSTDLQAQAETRSFEFELLAGIQSLKAAGAELGSVQSWSKLFVRELNVSLDRGRLQAVVNSVLDALAVASPLAVLLYGSLLVIRDELSLGMMLGLNALALGFLMPLSALVTTAFQLQLMGSYLQRVDEVLAAPRERLGAAGQPVTALRGNVTLEEVTFRYAATAPAAVDRLSVEIRAGSFVGIVGESGSGKSTLASLLAGLYLPDSGRIRYDGVDLADLDLRSLRSHLGLVPQQPYLFAASIRDNIALTHPEMPLTPIIEAARLACVHDDVMAMAMRYDTLLAEGGASVSGGQRQRIALAQTLVRRPQVLILDEATSALDAMTERAVYDNLIALPCTRVVIAHRLSTVRDADCILVLDQGRIVERGTHSQLLDLGGKYRQLVEVQLEAGQLRPAGGPAAPVDSGGRADAESRNPI